MDIKQQSIIEYLTQGTGYRKLAAKYGVSRTTIILFFKNAVAHFVAYILRRSIKDERLRHVLVCKSSHLNNPSQNSMFNFCNYLQYKY